MSTKIYHGYILPEMNENELLSFCKKIKPLFIEEKKRQCALFFISKRVSSLDRNQFLGYELDSWEKINKELQERIQDVKKGYREPFADFSSNVLFFPMKEKTLALFYSDNQSLIELWQSQAEVREYHYQDQTDHPKDISDKDWAQRKKDWEKAIPSGVPSHNKSGIFFQFTVEDVAEFSKDECRKYFKEIELSKTNRINCVVMDLMFHHWSKHICVEQFKFPEAHSWVCGTDSANIKQEKVKEVSKNIIEYKEFDDLFN